MSHLIAIAVGPVQEFIAAARRTRDLWFGSHLLSEVSRAVAIAVEYNGGKLIFPATTKAENVANVILAELPDGDPKEVARKAREAAQERWLQFAADAWSEASEVIRREIWKEQVDDVIEFYAAWVTRSDNYKKDREKVMRLLAGRKSFRDFQPAKGRAGVPKSSLDGQRESVLKDPAREAWPERYRARLRVREGEQLDVVAMVKRVAGGNKPYPSIARIAADPWVRGNRNRLGDVISACEKLAEEEIIRPLKTTEHPQFSDFPFEGTAVYTSRHHELIEETGAASDSLKALQQALKGLEPEPYLAVLVADGDKMGEALSALNSPEHHREFSQRLAEFAGEAKNIVTNCNGVLVYAGGDDVLAFLPVDKYLDCARQLHDKFADLLKSYGDLTLSVGVAIGHFMENLEDLLEYGRQAEKSAKKPDRNGLAVHLHKRGGAPIKIRSSWKDDPDHRLKHFAGLMKTGIIPSKLPYELRTLARLYESWTASAETVIRQDLFRLIAKKTSDGSVSVREALSNYLGGLDATKLMILARELLIARQMATTLRQIDGPPARTKEVTS
ncbi:MAG: type III-B CRISPR-associated protein Cas10/Cmr2 [Blastocatellia bacterium]